MKRIRKIHFVGIGGIGMCGIAEVMLNQGYQVSGSDVSSGDNVTKLTELGAKINIGHSRDNIDDADVVVVSSAIDEENPEIVRAHELGIPVVPRAEMLSELMRKKNGIAISGTHGKTTTTSMIASMLDFADMSPTYVIGGRLLKNDKNASLGDSEYFIAEADESDGSFLLFHPVMSVVTNIDNDHLSVYRNSMDDLISAFQQFISDIPFYGCAVLCMEDRHIVEMLPRIHRRVLTYGFGPEATVFCKSVTPADAGMDMHVVSDVYNINDHFNIRLYGHHNVLNALASICVGLELGIDINIMKSALSAFSGISRRFNTYDIDMPGGRSVTVIDDYGHHPTEVTSVLDTIADVFSGRRIVFVFEPHRYSRVKSLFDGFVESLLKSDYQLVLPIYAASETDTLGVSSSGICDALRSLGAKDAHAVSDEGSLYAVLERVVENDDVLLFMGAGSIGRIVKTFLAEVG
ncbi:MAG: UDP-N-acetylmuramate--L-alanine ligase [Gammaproteobacteria bacterium]|nr:UDP-N-acetylmuramate--L-alanine ligase [Gammaproteobacteria bacterium]